MYFKFLDYLIARILKHDISLRYIHFNFPHAPAWGLLNFHCTCRDGKMGYWLYAQQKHTNQPIYFYIQKK